MSDPLLPGNAQPTCVFAVIRKQGGRESVSAVYAKEDSAKACCVFRNDLASDDVTYQWRVFEVQHEFRQ